MSIVHQVAFPGGPRNFSIEVGADPKEQTDSRTASVDHATGIPNVSVVEEAAKVVEESFQELPGSPITVHVFRYGYADAPPLVTFGTHAEKLDEDLMKEVTRTIENNPIGGASWRVQDLWVRWNKNGRAVVAYVGPVRGK